MSNTDGEDTQRIEDLDRKMWAIVQATPTFSSNPEDYLKPWRELINQELASLREQLKQKDIEIDTLENDLLDALDLKDGNGPTALTILSNKLKQKEQENQELKDLIIKIDVWRKSKGDFTQPFTAFPWDEFKSLIAKVNLSA